MKFYETSGLPTRRWLLEVMTAWYLFCHNYAIMVCKYVELPLFFLPGWFLRSQLLEPMCLGTVGSVESAYLAMHKGWAINLSGGFHHARKDGGEGFCVYPDITFITHYLRKVYGPMRIMIVDLDAHQGNGHERDHMHDDQTYIVDAYNHSIYPGDTTAARKIGKDISVRYHTSDEAYLEMVRSNLGEAIDEFKPEFLIYNAGTDCLCGDPLGALNISEQGIVTRDEIVFEYCLKQNIPLTMIMSGGYQQSNAEIIADSIGNLIEKYDLKTREGYVVSKERMEAYKA